MDAYTYPVPRPVSNHVGLLEISRYPREQADEFGLEQLVPLLPRLAQRGAVVVA